MGMSVDEHVARREQGRGGGIIMVPVGDEQSPSALKNQHIVGENGKFQYHLIHLGVAVAADAHKMVFGIVEKFDDLFGGVAGGNIISGAVVEQVAQKDEFFRFFCAKGVEHGAGTIKISVDIGGKHQFHDFVLSLG